MKVNINDLKIEYIDVKKLLPNEYNPKSMTKDEHDKIVESLEGFGMVEPIVVNKAKGRENITKDHFHDCDEWVFMVKGKCLMISEGKNYILEKGDVLVTRMGDTHELVKIIEDTAYFWCETALRGKKRKGHLHPGQDDPNTPDA